MTRTTFLTIGTMLRALLGVMLVVLIAALAVPTWSAITQLREATRVVATARAGQSVFVALQYLRPERGTVQAALTAPNPADATLLAGLAALRAKAAPAIEAVLSECRVAHCADDPAEMTAFAASIERLAEVRKLTDAADKLPLAERPADVSATWAAATTDVLTRIDRLTATLTERVRLVDARIAELMELKQIGWLVRDAAGLERNVYSEAINAKSLPTALQTRMAGYRGLINGGWHALRELTVRPGAPANVVAAMQGATDNYFGSFDKLRVALYTALLAGQPPPISLSEWLRVSTLGLDSLIQVPNQAVAEAQAYADRRVDEASRRLWLQAALLGFGLLVGGGGFLFVQRRVTSPIRAISATNQQAAATTEISHSVTETLAAVDAMSGRADDVSKEAGLNGKHAGDVRDTASLLHNAVGSLKHAVTQIVRTSTTDADRRREPRRAADLVCRLNVPGHGAFEARLNDLSRNGARVIGGPALPQGARGTLNIDGFSQTLACVVRSRDEDGVLHLEFDLDEATQRAFRDVPQRLASRRAA